VESRCSWARKERWILDTLHDTHPPTHFATVKFERCVSVDEVRLFDRRVRQSVRYWSSKRNGFEFAVYFVREIEVNNWIHYHCLIRTTDDPWTVLPEMIDNASNETARLKHCELVTNVPAVTRYVVKDLDDVKTGRKPILLFKPKLGLHLSGWWNGYFVRPKGQLWDEWKQLTYGRAERPNGDTS
jgi:hypothetical protein